MKPFSFFHPKSASIKVFFITLILVALVGMQGWSENITWVGANGNSGSRWADNDNWNPKKVPTSADDVSINAVTGQTRAPIITTAAVCKSITIHTGASLTINSGGNLAVSGSWTNDGTFTQNSGTVTFTGDTQAEIIGNSNTTFSSLKVNKGNGRSAEIHLNGKGKVVVNSSLTIDNGLMKINTGGALDLSGTAVAPSSGIELKGGTYTVNGIDITPLGATNTWEGANNAGNGSRWADISNWSLDRVPILTDEVIIPIVTHGYYPIIITAAVCNSININSGASLTINSGGSLAVSGDWTNNGTFTQASGTTVTFNGTNSATISGNSVTAFNNIAVNKGTDGTTILEANGVGALSNSGSITITNGLFKMTTGTWVYGTGTIPSTGGIHVNGAIFSSGTFINNGLVRITSGTATFGSGTGSELTNQSNAWFDFQGGTVSFTGRLTNTANRTGTPPTWYTTSGVSISGNGILTVSTSGNASSTVASFHMSPTSNLSMTGGTVVFQKPNSNASPFNDLQILNGGTKSITGGTFQIGNASTLASNIFLINSEVQLANLTINATNTPTGKLASNLTLSGNLTIGGIFNIETKSLSVGGNLVQNGIMSINSDASNSGSLIIGTSGTSSGNVTYNRWLAHSGVTYGRWYIASAPVNVGSGFGTANNGTGTNTSKIHMTGSEYDFATYTESTNNWSYATGIPSGLTPGEGYLISLNSASDGIIQFTGPLNNGNVEPTVTSTGIGNGWNAVGNPYTSALDVSVFLTTNSTKLDENYAAIYVWNETGSYNGTTDQYYRVISSSNYHDIGETDLGDVDIQAGQGFLINTNAASTTLTFNKAMQLSLPSLGLKSAETSWPGITLLAESNGQTRSTVVAFNEAMTTGLDVTYDAGLLASDNFQVYTHLVSDNNQVDFAIQCLPDHQYSQLRVPVGVDLPDGGELLFKASGIILPDGIYPVIEDKLLGIQTPLKTETDTYKVTLDQNTTGIGRFYLSMGGDMALSTIKPQIPTNYTASFVNDRIVLNGAVEAGTKAMLFDICGRKLGEYLLENASRNEIVVTGMNQKVYLLKVEGKNIRQMIKLLAIKY